MFNFHVFEEPLGPTTFNPQYRCYSVSMFPGGDKQKVENGGKVIMPQSALESLARLNIVYPMLFKLTNRAGNRSTHCGVLEFVADEGKIYIPYWMMRNLLVDEGDMLQIESISLPVATFSKFEPQNTDFLDITNPKAVLENNLRNFACLTSDDVIAINYNDKIYEMRVLEVRPGNAVSIIECDMNVEFAAPIGYQEPAGRDQKADHVGPESDQMEEFEDEFAAFQGSGNRLDGKRRNLTLSDDELKEQRQQQRQRSQKPPRMLPDYDYEVGYLKFWRLPDKPAPTEKAAQSDEESKEEDKFAAFSGLGASIRKAKDKD